MVKKKVPRGLDRGGTFDRLILFIYINKIYNSVSYDRGITEKIRK